MRKAGQCLLVKKLPLWYGWFACLNGCGRNIMSIWSSWILTAILYIYDNAGQESGHFDQALSGIIRQPQQICTVGVPFVEVTGAGPIRCPPLGYDTCPQDYQCNGGYCCPTAGSVCREKLSPGNCTTYSTVWAYDQEMRDCHSFVYSGCRGNLNNFASYNACAIFCKSVQREVSCPVGKAAKDQNGRYIPCGLPGPYDSTQNCPANYYCYAEDDGYSGCCPSVALTCLMEDADPGVPCESSATARWYHNTRTRTCETFMYNGCEGNSNNFATRTACLDHCRFTGCPDHGEPFMENGRYKTCQSAGSSSVDCPANHTCSFISLSSTGNVNRGLYCCPTREHICSEIPEVGKVCGASTLTRYYFKTSNKECTKFTYNGCGTSTNNFASKHQCENFCKSAGCPLGQGLLTEGKDRISCNSMNGGWTPCAQAGGTCIRSHLWNRTLCCGHYAPHGTCPEGYSSYIDSLTSTPLQCTPNFDSCPHEYSCMYSSTFGNSYCCAVMFAQCPPGSDLLYDPVGWGEVLRPRQCTPGLAASCPVPYFCQPLSLTVSAVLSTTGHCCSLSNTCGIGQMAYREGIGVVSCNSTLPLCPAPFECQHGTCCAALAALADVCAYGHKPLYNEGSPTLCDPMSISAGCPVGYTCDRYSITEAHYCCSRLNVPGGCPAHSNPLNPIKYCSPHGSSSTCPKGYFCSYDTAQTRFICCSVSIATTTALSTTTQPPLNVCPKGRHPALDANSKQPITCFDQHSCPRGYACVYSPNGDYCCSKGDGCPNGTKAYVYKWSNTQLACLPPSGRNCPIGYKCVRSVFTGTSFQCCSKPVRTISTTPVSVTADGCPAGASSFIYAPSRTPLVCIVDGPACPAGYTCTPSSISSDYRCCSTASTTPAPPSRFVRTHPICPGNAQPYLYPGTGAPVSCSSNAHSCPKGYRCVQSSGFNGSSLCCKNFPTVQAPVRIITANEMEVAIIAFAGEQCYRDDDCRRGAGPNAACRSGFCVCASNEVNLLGICSISGCPTPYRNVAGKCVPVFVKHRTSETSYPWNNPFGRGSLTLSANDINAG